ncbi:MAG: hypothetical protein M3Y71_06185 [Actinomycetota bacterium]|nr:hypothetical protein [Actinomycetota bacterium]
MGLNGVGPVTAGGTATGASPRGGVMRPGARARTLPLGLLLLGVVASLLVGMSLPAAATGAPFVALATPARILDTRVGSTTTDKQAQGVGRVSPGQTLTLEVAGRVAIPLTGVGAVVLNVTSVAATTAGYVTVFPCGDLPHTSSLSYPAGSTVPNAVIAKLSATGTVCLYSAGNTDLVVDVSGYLLTSGVTGLDAPVRLLDTRVGAATIDGRQAGLGALAAGQEIAVPVVDRGGFTSEASSVILNLTVVNARSAGYLSVYPCGARPNSSSLNYGGGVTRANAVVTGLTNGQFCVFSAGAADVVIDASASLPASTFSPLPSPERLLDTRAGTTVDSAFRDLGPEPANASLTLSVAGRGSVPSGAKAVVLNLTAIGPTGSGYTSVYPAGPAPHASNLNYARGEIVGNLVVAPLSATGSACLTTAGVATDLVVDVTGYLTADVPAGTDPCPSLAVNTSPDSVRSQLVYRSALQKVVGDDRVAVVVCSVPTGYRGYSAWPKVGTPRSASTIATWANQTVAPYFVSVSGGAYRPTFVAAGPVTLTTPSTNGGPDDCLDKAMSSVATTGITNVLATDDRMVDFAFAGPGRIEPVPQSPERTVLTSGPPKTSLRGLYLGGDLTSVDLNPMIAVHEMGHTIHWPHSFISDDEYDNPTDVMSGSPGDASNGWCRTPSPGFAYPCLPQSALAFDRMAAGWMTSRQSAINSGVVNYALGAANAHATNTAGTQIVAVRDPHDAYSVLTLEGRAAVDYDQHLSGPYCHVIPDPASSTGATRCDTLLPTGHDGVVVSLVRQTPSASGISLFRRMSQAMGRPYSFDHVLQVGDSVTVEGVHIAVLARTGTVFTVQVGGKYTTPTRMVAPTALAPSGDTPLVPRSDTPGQTAAAVLR